MSLEKLWSLLKKSKSKSLLKKYLTEELYVELKDEKTPYGGTLADCIQSGCNNFDSGVGIYACDPQAYNIFAKLFDPVIKEYHKVDYLNHPESDFGDLDNLDLDLSDEFIISTRVQLSRSHASYGFPPVTTTEERIEIEKKSVSSLSTLEGELKGTYYPLTNMTDSTRKVLNDAHFLFEDKNRFLRDAGVYRDWPFGRGIYVNENKTFCVWVNEEDHLSFISKEEGSGLGKVYTRVVQAVKAMESNGLRFTKSKGLGYLTFSPTNLGTTLRVSVRISIPNLASSPEFKGFFDKHNIKARDIHGEHTDSVWGVYEITNKHRLGLTEIQVMQEMKNAIDECIAEEKKLSEMK